MAEKSYCVYKHTAPNGKVYIGVTSQMLKRRFNNGKGYFHNEHFKRAILLYGWENIKHEVLKNGLNREEAIDEEKRLIAFYNSTDQTKGYNLMTGGDGLGTHTQETCKKLSLLATGNKWCVGRKLRDETKEKIGAAQLGRKQTDERRAHVSACLKGRKQTDEHIARRSASKCKPVSQYLSGEEIAQYPSAKAAAESVGGFKGNITSCCRGRLKTIYGFAWRYAENNKVVGE